MEAHYGEVAGRPKPPLQLDSAALARRGSETSPNMSPIHSSNGQSRINTPSTSVPNTPIIPARAPSPERKQLHPGDSSSFLTALAGQERRVLELKEELQKAESDLERLKRQWAAHEALRKRNEARQLEQLRPLRSTLTEMTPIGEESATSKSREMDRRKTLSSSTKTSQRKVFSGSRHTRTLSLLSTRNSKNETSPTTSLGSPDHKSRTSMETLSTQSSIQETETPISSRLDREPFRSPDKDMILETGKQLVGDFRQGFWTFVEDLKQVTVGDENSSAKKPRPSSSHSIDPKKSGVDSKEVVATEGPNKKGILQVKDAQTRERPELRNDSPLHENAHPDIRKKSSRLLDQQCSDSENEPWDDWGTPMKTPKSDKKHITEKVAESSPLSDLSSSRNNISSSDPKLQPQALNLPKSSAGEIPWPALSNFAPGKLSKTASNLMTEWERSLATPTSESTNAGSASSSETAQKAGKSD